MIGNRRKMADNFLIYKKKNNVAFCQAVFVSFWIKFTVTVNFLLLVLKCLKFYCFMLQSLKIKCLVLSRYPHSDPLLRNRVPANIYRA